MLVDEMLEREIQRLHALESGLVAVFDRLDGKARSRQAAVSIVMLVEAADRHLTDLDRICKDEGWTPPYCELASVRAWREEVESELCPSVPSAGTDAICLSLLKRAVHLRIPCYESARLLAFHAERPLIARTLRLALEDETQSLERLRSAAELGVSFREAFGGPFV